MLKDLITGFMKRIGEHLASIAIGAFSATGVIAAWLMAPTVYVLELTRFQITISVAALLLVVGITIFVTYLIVRKRAQHRSLAPIDDLQRNVVRLLWCSESGCLQFKVLQGLLLIKETNRALLACQRLQQRGFVACNPYDTQTLVQLLEDGREYADKHELTKAGEIIQNAANSVSGGYFCRTTGKIGSSSFKH